MHCGYHVDGAPAPEVVALVEDDAGRLVVRALLHGGVEGLHVDDHAGDVRGLREGVQLVQPVRVIDEGVDTLAILLEEVLLGGLERLLHALANGDGGHDHNELAPTVAPVELQHRLGVDVGLAGARLHLHVQVAGDSRHVAAGGLGLVKLVETLHAANVGEELGFREPHGRVGIAFLHALL